MKQFSNIDLLGNEIQNVVIHSLSSAPSSPKEGQIYFDTNIGNKKPYFYNGSEWIGLEDTNNFTDGISFLSGVLYLTRNGLSDLSVNLDGRYATFQYVDNLLSTNNYWTKTGDIIRNNNIGNVEFFSPNWYVSPTGYGRFSNVEGNYIYANVGVELPNGGWIACDGDGTNYIKGFRDDKWLSDIKFKYLTDLSATYDDRTLIDKGYLDSRISSISGFVPYTGASSNVNLGEFQLTTGQITFDQTPTQSAGVAVLRWNDTDGTLDLGLKGGNVTLQLGQEQLVRIVNKTLSNLTEAGYQAVYTSGAQGQRLKVDLALANSDLTSAGTLGIVTENIDVNQEGFVTTNGLVRGINTTGSLQGETWSDGDILYLSPTVAGRLTNIKPVAPQHLVVVGICVHAHITQGSIFVKVDNGYELDELHNVLISSLANNDVLVYESSSTLWKNKSIPTILGYTPENVANKAINFSTVNDTLYPTVQAVKTYADSLVAGLLDDRGSYNASVNTFPTTGGSGTAGAVLKGDFWYVSVAGTLGGVAVNVGDSFRALVDSPAQTSTNWSILEGNLGFVPYNSTNPAGYTSNLGTVTSVSMTVPTGLSISGSPITNSGTFGLTFTAGYSIPTDTNQTNWTSAYTNRITSLTTTGSSGASTLISNVLNIPNYTLSGLGGQPLDADLTAIAALAGTSGFLKKTATDTWALDTSTYLTSAVTTLSGGTTGLTPNTATSGAITLAGTLVVANGGTGSTTASGARTNLGATTVGGNVFTSTNPTAITFLRANADNTVSWLDAATFRTAIGAGTSTITPSALTKVDDTNVTLTLGGTPATALLQGVSLTLGWTGTLADSRIASASIWNAKQAALSGTGIVKSTAGVISYLTDNSTNWDSAYTNRITSLTTTGSSGASTLISNVLNIPTYTLSGLGGQASSTNLTSLSGLTFASTAFVKMTAAGTFALDTTVYTSNLGTVTSVASITLGTTGTDLSSSVATGTTTPVITLNVPTASATNRGALSSTDWSTFNNKQGALTLTTTGTSGAATLIGNTLNIPQYSGGGGSGTVTSVSAITLGTTGTDLSSSVANSTTTPVITLNVPTASATNRGVLSSADWSTFNGKQNALTNPVTGTSTVGYVSFWGTTSSIAGSSSLFWDNTNKYLGIGTAGAPATPLHVRSTTSVGLARIQGLGDVDNYSVLELWDDTGASKWQFAHKAATGQTKDFAFAHYNGTSWIAPLLLKDNGRVLFNTSTDDGTNQVQVNGYVKSTGYRIPSGTSSQYLMADGSTSTLTNPITGTGTINTIPKFTASGTLGNSLITSDSATVLITSTTDAVPLTVKSTLGATSSIGFQGTTSTNSFNTRLGATADDMVFFTSNTERLRILSGGNIAIGATSASRKLTVSSSDSEQLLLTSTNSTSNLAGLFLNPANTTFTPFIGGTGNDIVFHTVGAEKMRITSSGNIGINTTSPDSSFDINGYAVFGANSADRLSIGERSIGFNRKISDGSIYSSTGHAYQFQHTLSTTNTGDVLALQVYTPAGANVTTTAIGINGLGNVGIGIGSASVNLEVNCKSTAGVVDVFKLKNNSSANSLNGTSILLDGFYSQSKISSWENPVSTLGGNLQLQTYNNSGVLNTGILLNKSGNVGINTISPSFTSAGRTTVDVNGTSQSMLALSVGGVGKGFLFHTGTDLLVSNEITGSIKLNTNGTQKAEITSGGNILLGTTTDDGVNKLQVNGSGKFLGKIISNRLSSPETISPTYMGDIRIHNPSLTSLENDGGIEFKASDFSNGYGAKILAIDNGTLLIGTRFNSVTWSEKMRIMPSNGNILIGTTTDDGTNKLQVSGSGFVTSKFKIRGASGGYTTGDNPMISLGADAATNTFGTIEMPFGDKLILNAYHGFNFKVSNSGASPVEAFRINIDKTLTASSLATGTTTQMVTTDLNGNLGYQAIPSGGGATNLSYTASSTNGIVVSDTGTDATLPLANGTNAGLLSPSGFTNLSNAVLTSGNQSISGQKGFSSAGTPYSVSIITNDGTAGLYVGNSLGNYGIYGDNTSTGIGAYISNSSTGQALVLNNTTAGTGMPFSVRKNSVDALTISDNGSIDILGTNADITMKGITNEPGTPSADNITLYAKKIGGKMVLKTKDEYGVDFSLQNSFWDNNITYWSNTNATAGVWEGTIGAGAGTFTQALPTTTSIYTSIKRARYANVVTTTNQVLGQRNTEAMFFRGGLAGIGGFFFYARFGFDVWTNGSRLFAGFHSGTTVISADPSALNNTMGFCVDAADNGLISFLSRDTVSNKTGTGFAITTGKGYDVYMYAAPNSSTVYWKIEDLNAGTEVSGIKTLNLPTNTTMLTAGVLASNGSLTTVTATQLGINKIYIETDY